VAQAALVGIGVRLIVAAAAPAAAAVAIELRLLLEAVVLIGIKEAQEGLHTVWLEEKHFE